MGIPGIGTAKMPADPNVTGQRRARQWPAWVDDVLAYGPIAELEDEWRAAIGDAVTRVLDLRNGSREITCACCGTTKVVPDAR